MSRKDFVPEFTMDELQDLPCAQLGSGFYEVDIEYENDRWDGPLSGMCAYHGKRYYFHCIDLGDWSENHPRRYVLLALTEQQLIAEEYWHQQFVQCVESRPQDPLTEWRKNFYDPYERAVFEPCTKDQAVGTAIWPLL